MKIRCTVCDTPNKLKIDNRLVATGTKSAEITKRCTQCQQLIFIQVQVC